MRVLHFNLSKGWRGGERQTLLLMQCLRGRGVESALVAALGEPLAERALADRFEVVQSAGLHWARTRADIAHAHEARGLQLAALWKMVHRRPMLATRRVYFQPKSGIVTRLKYAAADRIVSISPSVAQAMTEWGARPDRLRTIYSAVATEDRSDPNRVSDLRARFAGGRIVGCVGALTAEKDHATLLRAFKRVQDARSDVALVLLGDGELRARLEEQARSLGLSNVHFEGFQADPYSYFKVFDVLAMTSTAEGLGTSILDAFAYGVPVVATAAGGTIDLVKDGRSGLLCPIGDDAAVADGILSLLTDPELRERVRCGAREMLESEFTVDRMTDGYLDVYNELLFGREYSRA